MVGTLAVRGFEVARSKLSHDNFELGYKSLTAQAKIPHMCICEIND